MVFQYREEQSWPNFESRVSAIKLKFGAALSESDAYLEQFRTEKSKFIVLVSSSCALTESHGNTKNEGLKELWRDFVVENG